MATKAKKNSSTTSFEMLRLSDAEIMVGLLKEQADSKLQAAKARTEELLTAKTQAAEELRKWQSVQQQLADLLALTSEIGIALDGDVTDVDHSIEASVGGARQALSEAETLVEISPEVKVWGKYNQIIEAQKQAKAEADAARRAKIEAELDKANWALFVTKKAAMIDHGTNTLKKAAVVAAHQQLGHSPTYKQGHAMLVNVTLPKYLATQGFVATRDGVQAPSFVKICHELADAIDPVRYNSNRPHDKSENVAATVATGSKPDKQRKPKPVRENPKGRKNVDDDDGWKPSVDQVNEEMSSSDGEDMGAFIERSAADAARQAKLAA